MSRFAAIVGSAGPISPASALERMVEAMTPPAGAPGDVSARSRVEGDVALASIERRCAPRGAEDSPYVDATSGAWLSFAGRLDDRDALRESLRARGEREHVDSDSGLVLAAWRAWGEECAPRLFGDFAFALWDPRRRVLFCARDVFGVRPFHYARGPSFFAAASELRALLAIGGVDAAPNEAMVADYLATTIDDEAKTLYRSIFRLPRAHCLRLRGDDLRIWRYWTPRPVDARWRSDAEADEEVRATLERAVRSRLRGAGTVGVDVSGGLDSSAVAMTARRVAIAESTKLESLSLVFPGMACDESPHIARVEAALGLPANRVVATLPTRALFESRARIYRDFPGHPNGLMSDALYARARERGVAIELTGLGGDDWWDAASDAARTRDRIARGDVVATLRDVGLRGFVRAVAREIAPAPLRALARRVKRMAAPSWIAPRLLAMLRAREGAPSPCEAPLAPSQREILDRALLGWTAHAFELEEREAAAHGIELRHPFWDRRMVELALALADTPAPSLTSLTFEKPALRRALRGVVPDEIRLRRDKPSFDALFSEALREVGGPDFEPRALIERGWIDGRAFRAEYTRALGRVQGSAHGRSAGLRGDHGDSGTFIRTVHPVDSPAEAPPLWPLWMVVGLEIWVTLGM